ncbi:MAG: glutamate synthase subunit beta [Lachnospiraceae bacterium]|nr:glutamate synthase subunit beta [Lachnospiraceae bacterium]
MGKPTGFMEYERKDQVSLSPAERIRNFEEFHTMLSANEQRKQGGRCMDCGVPFCQYGSSISGMTSGCPLHNLVPETNDLVYMGNLEQVYSRLSKTHSFPEFTSRVCPALCEAACTCGLHSLPVATKSNERAIIDYAFEKGLVEEEIPKVRTGKTVAVIGSGPSGLAVAQLLNRRGHLVTVFERSERPGGLLRYGIPNMKLDKRLIDRRIELMEKAGVIFKCGVDIGKDISGKEIKESFDRVVLCCGASNPRDIQATGRDAKGIYFAVDFLSEVTRMLINNSYSSEKVINSADFSFGSLKGKSVVIIGGGDTGNDCVGTCVRLGAGNVTQLEMMPKAPEERSENNPWPEWPKVFKTDYGQEEAAFLYGKDPRVFCTTVTEFIKNKNGRLSGVKTIKLESGFDENTKRKTMVPVSGTEEIIKADIVLIAAGFLGSQAYVTKEFGVETDRRSNVSTKEDRHETSVKNIFAAGDMRRGQSLVVWAIAEGRAAAREVDESLMGYTGL